MKYNRMMKNKQIKNNEKLVNLLEKLGFSDNEVFVYLALLDLGHGTVSEIARKSGVGRTHAYVILDELIIKKLISISGKEPKQEYIVESPTKLKEYLEDQFSKQKNSFDEMMNIIPELMSLHKIGVRPNVKFYEGIDGLKTVYEDTLSSTEPIIRGFLSFDELHKTLPHYFPEYYKRRTEKGLIGKAIVTNTEEGRKRVLLNKKENRQTILVPKEYYFYPEIDIYNNKIMIASWREKLGIIIESDEIADAMKKIFELAWLGAKSLQKK